MVSDLQINLNVAEKKRQMGGSFKNQLIELQISHIFLYWKYAFFFLNLDMLLNRKMQEIVNI